MVDGTSPHLDGKRRPDHEAAGSASRPCVGGDGASHGRCIVAAHSRAGRGHPLPLDQCLVVQGGPARTVGLHAACCSSTAAGWCDGVLVVGPNTVFLDYIGNVLLSLGERG